VNVVRHQAVRPYFAFALLAVPSHQLAVLRWADEWSFGRLQQRRLGVAGQGTLRRETARSSHSGYVSGMSALCCGKQTLTCDKRKADFNPNQPFARQLDEASKDARRDLARFDSDHGEKRGERLFK
jgi:hypothetical protein